MKKRTAQRITHPSKTNPGARSIVVNCFADLVKIASTLAHGRKKKKSNEWAIHRLAEFEVEKRANQPGIWSALRSLGQLSILGKVERMNAAGRI